MITAKTMLKDVLADHIEEERHCPDCDTKLGAPIGKTTKCLKCGTKVDNEKPDTDDKEESLVGEAVDIAGVISTLIDTSFGGSNEEQMKAVQLLKGLATSDDPLSDKFMKALDKFTSAMNKDDFK